MECALAQLTHRILLYSHSQPRSAQQVLQKALDRGIQKLIVITVRVRASTSKMTRTAFQADSIQYRQWVSPRGPGPVLRCCKPVNHLQEAAGLVAAT